jgi:hypothetical protein
LTPDGSLRGPDPTTPDEAALAELLPDPDDRPTWDELDDYEWEER